MKDFNIGRSILRLYDNGKYVLFADGKDAAAELHRPSKLNFEPQGK